MASFTGPELEQALLAGELAETGSEITGMVKPSEIEKHVSFAKSGCGTWTDIPTAMIESAERLGEQLCTDGFPHPVFRIVLKRPDDEEAQVLANLLANSTPASSLGPQAAPFQFSSQPVGESAVGQFTGPAGSPQPLPGTPVPDQFSAVRNRVGTGDIPIGTFPTPWGNCVVVLTCVEHSELFPEICNRWEPRLWCPGVFA
ncbi:hypothetical protein ABIE21_001428 [Conyzicola nivalis]|uniref:Uncharacterized protein n=1 Tax=Conyzicola nivalis TaxID=1477021 RepID=A0ABV2QN41_9MICO